MLDEKFEEYLTSRSIQLLYDVDKYKGLSRGFRQKWLFVHIFSGELAWLGGSVMD